MSFPKVSVQYSNGNLLQSIDAIDGIAGIVATVATVGLIGVPKQVFSLADAESKGFTLLAEPFLYNILKEFYTEVGGTQELWVMGTAETMTMASALTITDLTGAIRLVNAAEGKLRLLGVCRKPALAYVPGTEFLDLDVALAITASKTFCQAQLAALRPLRVLVEGRVANESSLVVYQPSTASNGFAGVVLGGAQANGTASVGLVLGRAVKYSAEVKIGKVANGPLSIANAYIGTKHIKDVPALETLHDKGYITFIKHPQKAGIYLGIDKMCSTDDYRLLAYGRVVDKAAIIAAATYVEQIESEVDVNPATGRIAEIEIKHLEAVIRQQIEAGMGDQISGLQVIIDPNQDIINTSTLLVQLRVIPKGYTSFIIVDLGLKAPQV